MKTNDRCCDKAINTVTRERVARMLIGSLLLLLPTLACLHHPYWIFVAVAVGLNMMQSAVTERCFFNNTLKKLGLPGERELGRKEAFNDNLCVPLVAQASSPILRA